MCCELQKLSSGKQSYVIQYLYYASASHHHICILLSSRLQMAQAADGLFFWQAAEVEQAGR